MHINWFIFVSYKTSHCVGLSCEGGGGGKWVPVLYCSFDQSSINILFINNKQQIKNMIGLTWMKNVPIKRIEVISLVKTVQSGNTLIGLSLPLRFQCYIRSFGNRKCTTVSLLQSSLIDSRSNIRLHTHVWCWLLNPL